jgi:hypothetical protein
MSAMQDIISTETDPVLFTFVTRLIQDNLL